MRVTAVDEVPGVPEKKLHGDVNAEIVADPIEEYSLWTEDFIEVP